MVDVRFTYEVGDLGDKAYNLMIEGGKAQLSVSVWTNASLEWRKQTDVARMTTAQGRIA